MVGGWRGEWQGDTNKQHKQKGIKWWSRAAGNETGKGMHSDTLTRKWLWDHLTLGAEGQGKVLNGLPLLWHRTVGWVVYTLELRSFGTFEWLFLVRPQHIGSDKVRRCLGWRHTWSWVRQGAVQRGSQACSINKESGPDGQLGVVWIMAKWKTLAPSKWVGQASSPSATAWWEFQPSVATSSNFNKKKTEI